MLILTSYCWYQDHLCNVLLDLPASSFSLPQTTALGGNRGGHTQSLCKKRFTIRVSSSWQRVSDFFLLSPGLVWVYICTFPQHSPHHCWYCADPAHTGEVSHPLPAAGVASASPTRATLWPHSSQDTTGLLLMVTKSYTCRSHAATLPLRDTTPATQSQWCLTLGWALLSDILSYYYRFMRASHTMICLSLLLPAVLWMFSISMAPEDFRESNPEDLTLEQNGCLWQRKYSWTRKCRSPQEKNQTNKPHNKT